MTVCDINLIAGRRAQKLRALAIMRCVVYSLMAVLLGVTLLYARMFVATRSVQGQITEVAAHLTDPALADAVVRIRFLESNIARLDPRVSLLQKVHDSEQAWIYILQDMSGAIPKGVWMSQMSSRRDAQEQVLSVRGSAYRQRDIGEFMLRLEKVNWSDVPKLGYTQANLSLRGTPVIDFEVAVPLNRIIGSELR